MQTERERPCATESNAANHSFRETHCLRNKIHTNLFATYILSNFCWIITSATIYVSRLCVLVSSSNQCSIYCICPLQTHNVRCAILAAIDKGNS